MCKAFGSGGAQPVGTRVEPRRSVPPSTHGEPPLARTLQRRAFRKAACPGSAPRPRVNAPAAMQEGGADARKVFGGDRAAYI